MTHERSERADAATGAPHADLLLTTGALQSAIFNSANFSSIATDANGVIQIFNVGAERMLGYTAADVMNRVTAADLSDPEELVVRAMVLSVEFGTRITPGFEALVFKASRGIEDIYELTYFRKDGSRFPAVVSVTALRDAQEAIIGYLLIGTDNTARKHAEEALHENYALLRTIHLHSIVSVTDRAGVIVDANDGFCKISGYSRDELLGQTHRIVNSGVQSAAFWTEMWRTIVAGRSWRGEICNRTKEGALYWVDSIIAPFMTEDGRTKRYISVRTDVTARKQAEEALVQAGALQSAIFNSANFSSIATDAKGVIQIFNVGAERMLGYTAAEVVNTITPADISDPQEVIARATALSVELGTPITPGFEALVFKASRGIEDIYELTYIRKNGSRFPAVVSVTALRDAHNTIIGYLLIGTDNTARQEIEEERKKLDQGFRDQQFYTRSLIESNIDALMATDPRGIITDVNKQTEALTGCTRDELIGAPFKNYFTNPARAEAGIHRVLSEGKVTNYELTARRRDGTQTVVSYNATTFHDRDRKLRGVFAAARDMTELKRYEHTLQQNELQRERDATHAKELAVVNQELEAFSYSVSHDLRAPLRHIQGYVEMLRKAATAQLSDKAQHYLTTIGDASVEMGDLIDDLLAFSRVARDEIRGTSVELGALVQDVIRGLEMVTHDRSIVWQIATLPRVVGDAALLKQVLTNLIDNAIKYSRPRDPARIEIGAAGHEAGRVTLFVRDNGVGFDMQYADKLFGVFQRLHRPEEFEGTGIGLATVRRIIGRHGGRVWAEGALDMGATFFLTLELAPSGEAKA